MLKVLQVALYIHPAPLYGGPPRSVYYLSKALAELGHNVTVIATDAYDSKTRASLDYKNIYKNLKILRFRNISNFLAVKRHIFIAPEMYRFISRNISKYDIIHLHEYRTFQEIFVHHYSKKMKIPYILQPRGSINPMKEEDIFNKFLKKLYDNLYGKKILKDAALIFALNKIEKTQLRIKGIEPQRIKIIPNGVELPSRIKINTKSENDKNIIKILYLGRIDYVKGIDILIKAFSIIIEQKKQKNVVLIIAGPDYGFGKYIKKLVFSNNNIRDKVIFKGYVDGEEKSRLFMEADIFVLPSRYDAFPLSVLEAAAHGLPLVISNKCYISEWIKSGEAIIVSAEKHALAESIYNLIISEKLRKTLSSFPNHYFLKYF